MSDAPASERDDPCRYCRGGRWYFFCGENVICERCPAGKSLLLALATENDVEAKRRSQRRSMERRIASAANRPRTFELRLTREQLFAAGSAIGRMLDSEDVTNRETKAALFNALNRIDAALDEERRNATGAGTEARRQAEEIKRQEAAKAKAESRELMDAYFPASDEEERPLPQ